MIERKLFVIALMSCVEAACASMPRVRPSAALPISVALQSYPDGFRTVCVRIDGADCRPFLLDTGSGITILTPATARALGCEPYGRITAFRMRGQRVDLPQCRGITLSVGGALLRPRTVGVFDLMAAGMPPDWPPLAGVLALDAFAGKALTIDLAHGSLTFSDDPTSINHGSGTEAQIRVERAASGASLCVFVRLDSPRGPLWIEIDSGSDGPLILDRELAPLLGVSVGQDIRTVPLSWSGFGIVSTAVKTDGLILDGNVGVPFLQNWVLTFDLRSERAWVSPVSPKMMDPQRPSSTQEIRPPALMVPRSPAPAGQGHKRGAAIGAASGG